MSPTSKEEDEKRKHLEKMSLLEIDGGADDDADGGGGGGTCLTDESESKHKAFNPLSSYRGRRRMYATTGAVAAAFLLLVAALKMSGKLFAIFPPSSLSSSPWSFLFRLETPRESASRPST